MAEKNPNKLYEGIKAIQDNLESVKNIVDEINNQAKALMADADDFGGIIAQVIKEQMAKYFIPAAQGIVKPIDDLVKGDRVPGSLKDLTVFLDSVPLAMIRQEPSVSELAAPVVPDTVDIASPAESKVDNPVDDIPAGASYDNGVEEAPVQESQESKEEKLTEDEILPHKTFTVRYKYTDKELGIYLSDDEKEIKEINVKADDEEGAKRVAQRAIGAGEIISVAEKEYTEKFGESEKVEKPEEKEEPKEVLKESHYKTFKRKIVEAKKGPVKYQVVRVSTVGPASGEDVANIEPQVVSEFNTKEEADVRCEDLNSTILPEEKELLGTEYKVEEKEIKLEEPEPYKEPKDVEKA